MFIYIVRVINLERQSDFMLSKKRDKQAALGFFNKAIGENGLPEKVTMDKSGANKSGIDAVNLLLTFLSVMTQTIFQITVRQIKYLNNIIEQDVCHELLMGAA